MPRLLSPDTACIEVDTKRRRYKGTTIEVNDARDERDLRAAGYTVASVAGAPAKSSTWTCTACAFRGFFRTCGRCGGVCQR